MGIFREKELWATNVHHLNDAHEYKHACSLLLAEMRHRRERPNLDDAETKYWSELIESFEDDPKRSKCCVVSFSTEGNQLSQWRAYCSSGNGYSLGFTFENLSFLRRSTRALLVKCVYDPEEQVALIQTVLDYLDRASRKAKPYDLFKTFGFLDRVFRKINAGMLALKDSGFKEENEWRLVVEGEEKIALDFRPGRFGIMPYRKLPLCKQSEKAEFREVYIGPHPEPDTAREALDSFLSEHARRSGHPAHDRIKDSSIPYRY